MRKHLRHLLELFLPEARFPDEKFWSKDGDPIHAKSKGPPPGTVGKTHADLGAGYNGGDDDEPKDLTPEEAHKLVGSYGMLSLQSGDKLHQDPPRPPTRVEDVKFELYDEDVWAFYAGDQWYWDKRAKAWLN